MLKRSFRIAEDMAEQEAAGDTESAENRKDHKLPELTEGQVFEDVQADISEHFTSAPKHFTEDQLLLSMETAGKGEFENEGR